MGPFILQRKQPDTTPSIHFFYSGCTTQRMFSIFVKVRIPGGTVFPILTWTSNDKICQYYKKEASKLVRLPNFKSDMSCLYGGG